MQKNELRKEKILELLMQKGEITVREIAEHCDISSTIARRLCTSLADEGKLLRTHGGVRELPKTQMREKYQFYEKLQESHEEKQRIAQYASSLVKSGEVLFLESGSTVHQFSINLGERIQKGELKNLVIYTNSLVNFNILAPVCNVSLIGGLFRPERQYFVGLLSERSIRDLHFDYCYLGADAISIKDGLMTCDVELVNIDSLLVSNSDKVIVLADSSKFQQRSLISYASLDEVNTIITDSNLSPRIADDYKRASNVKIICV